MIKKGFIIDSSKFIIVKNCNYDDKRIEGMWYKVDGEMIPIAYIFPEESRLEVESILTKCRNAKKEYEDLIADVYYKQFPKLR